MRWIGRGLFLLAGLWMTDLALTRAILGTRVDQPLASADRIVVGVHTGSGERIVETTITDPPAIARVVAFVDTRPRGWLKSWHTPPAYQVHVMFYKGEAVLGWFGSGADFLQARAPDGQVALRSATPAELEELNRLLGLPPGSHRQD
ncbi:MAG TPA: hypothetical protein VFZ20_29970 [Longimicrobium sp.]|nr:hypothetical protein [Longimicrobium sp.]